MEPVFNTVEEARECKAKAEGLEIAFNAEIDANDKLRNKLNSLIEELHTNKKALKSKEQELMCVGNVGKELKASYEWNRTLQNQINTLKQCLKDQL